MIFMLVKKLKYYRFNGIQILKNIQNRKLSINSRNSWNI